LNPHVPDLSRGVMPAQLLPLGGFMHAPRAIVDDHALEELIMRVNAGSLAYLRVPSSLVYRWASLCARWSPDLRTFVAQVLRHTGNLDNFLVQPAATDHHRGPHGLLEASLAAAELVMNPGHDARNLQPLPPQIDDVEQVCSAAAFLFDIGKVFHPMPTADGRRAEARMLAPYSDLSRCWRSSWKALANRNPVLAGWMHHVGRAAPSKAAPVEIARCLTRNAVKASWGVRSTVRLV
jgi:hypothetical protein